MKKNLPLVLAFCALPTAVLAENTAPGFQIERLQLGGSLSHNVVDSPFGGGNVDAMGVSIFAGYELDNDIDQVKTTVEIGYSQTDDFFKGPHSEISGLWVAGVVEKQLPEINPNLFALARLGLDLGDDDGILLGAGAGFHLTPKLDIRGEYINKDASSVYQASFVLNF
ncbi:outer membrane beta-barrel protein [Thalassolituus sp. UBA2009]|uniref:outer membrane beta-barrel protein n=1 Tax=Thalassolituus sp. UBA2009 TaxID=1947658 RepID=UPI00257E6A88|nr:hypothetical protein [Thalassolituus sp. UBA2009]